MSGSFYVEESGMGKSSERPNLVDSDTEGRFQRGNLRGDCQGQGGNQCFEEGKKRLHF